MKKTILLFSISFFLCSCGDGKPRFDHKDIEAVQTVPTFVTEFSDGRKLYSIEISRSVHTYEYNDRVYFFNNSTDPLTTINTRVEQDENSSETYQRSIVQVPKN